MTVQLKTSLLHALFVGILSGVLIGFYALLNVIGVVPNPLFWASFIVLPTVFMFGGQWKDIPWLVLNVLFGLFVAWLCYQWVYAVVGSWGLPLAFGISVAVLTVVLQGITGGFLANSIGRCPMAFVGMITGFASGADGSDPSVLVVAVVSLIVGIIGATIMAQSGAIAAKLAGAGKDNQ